MATYVDESRIKATWDSSDFDRNIQASIKSIEEFNKSLKFENSAKSLETLASATDKLSFEGLRNGMQEIQRQVSSINNWFTNPILREVRKIEDSLVQTAEKFVKSATVDPIMKGWDQYAEKTKAVQTIMAALPEEFRNIDYVNSRINKLNWYADETSASLQDMTGNIGKFTAAGVDLEDSVTAMIGISNWAYQSGQNAQSAAHAMYQLSQALGTGKIRVQDWVSIERTNMATEEFKKLAIETAKEVGTLTELGEVVSTLDNKLGPTIVGFENFRDTLAKDWLTNDVFIATVKKYGGLTEEVYEIFKETGKLTSKILDAIEQAAEGNDAYLETFKGYPNAINKIQELAKEVRTVGFESLRNAQAAITFQQAIESVTEAAKSKWSQIFESMFGSFNEVKVTWTKLAEDLWTIFVQPIDEILKTVQDAFDDPIRKLFTGNGIPLDSLNDFQKILFNNLKQTNSQAKELIEKGASLEDVLREGKITTEEFQKAMSDFLTFAENTSKGITDTSNKTVSSIKRDAEEVAETVWDIMSGKYGSGQDRIDALMALNYTEEEVKQLQNLVDKYWGYAQGDYTKEYVLSLIAKEEAASNFASSEEQLVEAQKNASIYTQERIEQIRTLKQAFDEGKINEMELAEYLSKPAGRWLFVDSLKNIMDSLIEATSVFWESINEVFGKVTGGEIRDILVSFHKWSKTLGGFLKETDDDTVILTERGEKLKKVIVDLVKGLKGLAIIEGIKVLIPILGKIIGLGLQFGKIALTLKILSVLEPLIRPLFNLLKSFGGLLEKVFNILKEKFSILEKIRDFINKLDISKRIEKLAGKINDFTDKINNLTELDIIKWFKNPIDIVSTFRELAKFEESVRAKFQELYNTLKEIPIVSTILEKLSTVFKVIAGPIVLIIKSISDAIKKVGIDTSSFGAAFGSLKDIFKETKKNIQDFWKQLKEDSVFGEAIKVVSDRLTGFVNKIKEVFEKVKGMSLADIGKTISDSLKSFFERIKDGFSSVRDFGKMIGDTFVAWFNSLDVLGNVIKELFGGLLDGLKPIGDKILAFWDRIKEFINGIDIHFPNITAKIGDLFNISRNSPLLNLAGNNGLGKLLSNITYLINALVMFGINLPIFSKIRPIINGIQGILGLLKNGSGDVTRSMIDLTKAEEDNRTVGQKLADSIDKLKEKYKNLKTDLKPAIDALADFARTVKQDILNVFKDKFGIDLEKIFGGITWNKIIGVLFAGVELALTGNISRLTKNIAKMNGKNGIIPELLKSLLGTTSSIGTAFGKSGSEGLLAGKFNFKFDFGITDKLNLVLQTLNEGLFKTIKMHTKAWRKWIRNIPRHLRHWDRSVQTIAKGIKSFLKNAGKAFVIDSSGRAFKQIAAGIKDIAIGLALILGAVALFTHFMGKDETTWKQATQLLTGLMIFIGVITLIIATMITLIAKFGKNAVRLEKDVNKIKQVNVNASLMSVAGVLLSFAAVVGVIVGALFLMEKLWNSDKAWASVITVGVIIAVIAALIILTNSFGGIGNSKVVNFNDKFRLPVLGMIIGLIAIVALINKLNNLDVKGNPLNLIGKIAIVIGAFAALMLVASACSNGALKGALALAIIAVSIKMLLNTLTLMGSLEGLGAKFTDSGNIIGTIIKSFAFLAGTLSLFKPIAKEMKSEARGVALAFIGMAAAIIMLTGAIIVLSMVPWDIMWRGALAVGAMMGILTLFTVALKDAKTIGWSLTSFALAVGILAAAVIVLGTVFDLSDKNIQRALGVISLLMLVLGASIGLMGKGDKAAAAILSMIGVIVAIGGVIFLLTKYGTNLDQAVNVAAAMGIAIAAIAASIFILSLADARKMGNKNRIKAIAQMGAVVAILGAVIAAIVGVTNGLGGSFDGVLEFAAGVSLILVAMAGVVAVMSLIKADKVNVGPLLALSIAVVVIGGLLAVLKGLSQKYGIDLSGSIQLAIAIGILLLAISASLLLLPAVGVVAKQAYAGIGVFFVLCLAIAALIAGAFAALYFALDSIIAKFTPDKLAKLKDVAVGIGDAIGSFIGAIKGSELQTESAYLPETASNLDEFATKIQNFKKTMEEFGTGTAVAGLEAVRSIIFTLANNDITNKKVNKIAEALDTLGPSIADFGASIEAGHLEQAETVFLLCAAIESLNNVDTKNLKNIGGAIDTFFSTIKEKFSAENLSSLSSTAEGFLGKIFGGLNENTFDISQYIPEGGILGASNFDPMKLLTGSSTGEGYSFDSSQIAAALGMDELTEGLPEELRSYVDGMNFDDSAIAIDTNWDTALTTNVDFTDTGAALMDNLTTALTFSEEQKAQISASGGEIAMSLANGISAAASGEEFTSSIALSTTAMATAISNGFSTSVSGGDFISSITSSISSLASTVQTAVANNKSFNNSGVSAANSVVSGFSSGSSGTYSIGQNIVGGLINGMWSMAASAANAGYTIGRRAAIAVRSGAQVNSPSKITLGVGKSLDEGLILGMKALESNIYKEGDRIGENSAKSFSNAIASIASAIDTDIDYNPTITPVLDLSQIQNGMGTMNSMFGSRSIDLSASARLATSTSTQMSNRRIVNDTPSSIINSDNSSTNNVFNIRSTDPKGVADEVDRILNKKYERRSAAWA